jgi:hypothetical protein
MIVTGITDSIGAALMKRAHRYERLALRARQVPHLVKAGYTLAGLFVFLGMMDVLSTNWALSVGAYELNDGMRAVQEHLGSVWYVPKLFLQAMIAAMIVWSPNRITIFIMTVMCGWTSSVVTNNFIIAYSLS